MDVFEDKFNLNVLNRRIARLLERLNHKTNDYKFIINSPIQESQLENVCKTLKITVLSWNQQLADYPRNFSAKDENELTLSKYEGNYLLTCTSKSKGGYEGFSYTHVIEDPYILFQVLVLFASNPVCNNVKHYFWD